MKKRTLSLLLAVACALSLSGCGGAPAPDAQTSAPAGSETPAAVDQTREIVFAASRDQCPGEQDAYYASMSLGVWEPLITKDESGKPAPALATEWEHNEDSTVWTFHLREGVTFSNGTPFNADSVLANFDRMKKGPFESSFYGMNIDTIYPGLVSYEKTDDYTVVLTLSEGQPLLDYTMVNYGSAIFEPSCFAEDGTFAGFPIGTGPYVVTENVLGQYCVIERNDNYWGTPGIAKTFRFKVIPDAETRYTALRAGEVQGLCDLGAISPSQAAEIDGDPAYNVSVGDSGITHFLNVNGGAFPFNDVRMRFIGVITEHFAGAFPTWLAPVQVKVLPITDRAAEYADQVAARLDALGYRVETDHRSEKIGFKIRQAQLEKVPYMLVVGDKEAESGQVAVRARSKGDLGAMDFAAFLAHLERRLSRT